MFNFLFLPLPLLLHVIIFYHVTYIFVLFLFHMTKNEQYFNVDRGAQTTRKLVLADVRVVWTGDGGANVVRAQGALHTKRGSD